MHLTLISDHDPRAFYLEEAAAEKAGLELTPAGSPAHDGVVYLPHTDKQGIPLKADFYLQLFRSWKQSGLSRLILISSTQIHPPRHGHPGMIGEVNPVRPATDRIATRWLGLEQAAAEVFDDSEVTILRAAPTPTKKGSDFFSRLLNSGLSPTLPGFDPSIQVMDVRDFATRTLEVAEKKLLGLFNMAPSGVMPLNKALSTAGVLRIPIPFSLQWAARKMLAPFGLAFPNDQMKRIRFPFTVNDNRLRAALANQKPVSSLETICRLKNKPLPDEPEAFDPYGLDPKYVAFQSATQLRFLHDLYWRVEYDGLEHVPQKGRGLLVGVHRGFMPYDGTMLLYAIRKALGRAPRFLIHPCLVKQPILARFITKLGGLPACRDNADYVLGENELLGVFPEGIQGAFTPYKQAYTIGNMGRDEYIRIALRNGAPIIPFLTVGSAEIYPILGRIDWGWYRRFSEWPFIPITPTFPFLPLPLPSKWHTRVLAPIDLSAQYPPHAADDPEIVARIGSDIKSMMQRSLDDLRAQRKSVFFGSIFNDQTQKSPHLYPTE